MRHSGLKQGHTLAVDWWSVGILMYEMFCGVPPFYVANQSEMRTYKMIMAHKVCHCLPISTVCPQLTGMAHKGWHEFVHP